MANGEQESIAAGVQRLGELGWREGENIHIEYRRITRVDAEHLRGQAAGLVAAAPGAHLGFERSRPPCVTRNAG